MSQQLLEILKVCLYLCVIWLILIKTLFLIVHMTLNRFIPSAVASVAMY